jgi:hypothetical protein
LRSEFPKPSGRPAAARSEPDFDYWDSQPGKPMVRKKQGVEMKASRAAKPADQTLKTGASRPRPPIFGAKFARLSTPMPDCPSHRTSPGSN